MPGSSVEEFVLKDEQCDCPAPAEGPYDSTIIRGRYYVKLRNQTGVTFTIDVWRDGSWRDEYSIPAGGQVLVEGESEQFYVRLCECETLATAAGFWTLKVWPSDQPPFASYAFYTDRTRRISLKSASR